jgi:cathepsin L
MREANFLAEHARVIAHNNSGASWKENINHMSHMTAAEKKVYLGHTKTRTGKLQSQKFVNKSVKPVSELPENVDWRTAGVVSAVKDQGHCGSCWAFASTAVIESHAAINTGLLFDLSPEQIAACAPNPDQCGGQGHCFGATAEIAFDYVASSEGMLEEFEYPYTSYYGVENACAVPTGQVSKVVIGGYVKLTENNYAELMTAVAEVGPIAVSVDASSWHAYDSGVFNGCNQTQPDINHAVTLVGYGVENGQGYWLVRNSWSASWGEAGYIKIHRGDDEEQNCGVDITPLDGSACAGQTDPVTTCGTCGILYDTAYPIGATATTASASSYFLY